MSDRIQSALKYICENFASARRDPLSSTHPIRQAFSALAALLEETEPVRTRTGSLHIDWSVGSGSWAGSPWVSFTSTTERAPRRGRGAVPWRGLPDVSVVYAFRNDLTGLYLTLMQKVGPIITRNGPTAALNTLESRSMDLRKVVGACGANELTLDDGMDLRVFQNKTLSKYYAPATIGYRFYSRDTLPEDAQIVADLEMALRVYFEVFVEKRADNRQLDPTHGTLNDY